MKIETDEMKQLLAERQQLTLDFGLKKLTEADFDMKLNNITKRISEYTQNFLREFRKEDTSKIVVNNTNSIENTIKEENKMADENVAKEVKVKKEKVVKPKKETRASLILKALQMKAIRNAEDVAKYVLQFRPTDTAAKIKAQTAVMIKETIAKKKRKNFTWDEANYLMTQNE